MPLFSSPKESYLGIDIGTASIKVVQLESMGGKPRLITYGYAEIATDVIRGKTPENHQKIVDSLKKIVASSRATTILANAALPTFSVFNSIISLPPLAAKDLAAAVKWEAKKYVPLPLEDMILDWQIIKEGLPTGQAGNNNDSPRIAPEAVKDKKNPFASFFQKKAPQAEESVKNDKAKGVPKNLASLSANKEVKANGNMRVLVTAAPKNLVSKYLSIFKESGLKLLSLETEAFALARSLIGQDSSILMIVDLGSITTDICVIEGGVPVLNRSIDLGGLTITKSIASSLNVTMERAEQFKRDYGVSLSAEDAQKGVNKTIASAIGPIINEIKYVFDLYQNQSNNVVEKIVLSGGSAMLNNFDKYLEKLFNKPAIIGNPWDRVIYPQELKPALDEVGPRLSVAIGLAMRDIK